MIFYLYYYSLQSNEHYCPELISILSTKFEDYQKYLCVPFSIDSTQNKDLVSLLLELHSKNSTLIHTIDLTDSNEESTKHAVDLSMATEALIIIAFESLENYVDLIQNYKFHDHLSKIFEMLDITSFKPKLFGFSGFLEINKDEIDKSSKINISDELLSTEISLPLNGVLKDRACTALIRNEGLSSAKKLMKNLLQNKSLVSNVNTEVLSDSTSFQSTQQNDEQNKDADSTEEACILAMIQKSYTGKSKIPTIFYLLYYM